MRNQASSLERREATSSGSSTPQTINTAAVVNNGKATPIRPEISDIVVRRLREALQDSHDRGTSHVKLDTELVSAILALLNQRQEEYNELKRKLDGVKVQLFQNGSALSYVCILISHRLFRIFLSARVSST